MKKLEADGWTCSVVEQTIPHTFIKRDCFSIADILCMSPTRGIMLVQATGDTHGTGNGNKRVEKIKQEPRAGIWLASGGRIQVHSWEGKGNQRTCRVLEVTKENNEHHT